MMNPNHVEAVASFALVVACILDPANGLGAAGWLLVGLNFLERGHVAPGASPEIRKQEGK